MASTNLVEWSVFEGLFVHALKPTGSFAEELKAAGVDLARPQPRYPQEVLDRALEIAARHAYPGLALPSAYRELGKKSGQAFFETLVGRITGAAMPMLGPDRVIASLPRRVQAGMSEGITVEKVSDKRWQVRFGPSTNAEFAAGNLETALMKSGISPKAEIAARGAQGTTIVITW